MNVETLNQYRLTRGDEVLVAWLPSGIKQGSLVEVKNTGEDDYWYVKEVYPNIKLTKEQLAVVANSYRTTRKASDI